MFTGQKQVTEQGFILGRVRKGGREGGREGRKEGGRGGKEGGRGGGRGGREGREGGLQLIYRRSTTGYKSSLTHMPHVHTVYVVLVMVCVHQNVHTMYRTAPY